MNRKGEMHQRYGVSSSPEKEPWRDVASIANTTATDEDRETGINESPPEIAAMFRTLRRRMWVGTVCVIIAIVALIKLLP